MSENYENVSIRAYKKMVELLQAQNEIIQTLTGVVNLLSGKIDELIQLQKTGNSHTGEMVEHANSMDGSLVELQKEVAGIHGNSCVMQAELSRVENGMKSGNYEI